MTIATETRVQRGYFRRYYQRTKPVRQEQARENRKCRYRRGWVKYLIAELHAYWSAERQGASSETTLQLILDYRPTSDQWMTYVCAGRSRHLIGRRQTRIRSTG